MNQESDVNTDWSPPTDHPGPQYDAHPGAGSGRPPGTQYAPHSDPTADRQPGRHVDQQPPVGRHSAQVIDPYAVASYASGSDTEADELAPVDRQADPAGWLPGRALIITAMIVGVALLATVIVCLIIWSTPPMHHLQVPAVPKS